MSGRRFSEHRRLLRAMGFRRALVAKFSNNGTTIYELSLPGPPVRKVGVQIWGDGGHRASHMVDVYGNTRPTDFRTPSQMLRAVMREATRQDNGKITGKYPN